MIIMARNCQISTFHMDQVRQVIQYGDVKLVRTLSGEHYRLAPTSHKQSFSVQIPSWDTFSFKRSQVKPVAAANHTLSGSPRG
jgi:hypothetical protein